MKQFTGYTCSTTGGGSAGSRCGCDWYSSCRNPLYAFDHPDECGTADMTLTGLDLVPKSQTIIRGRSGYFGVIARFSDGRTADVTGESVVRPADSDVATSPETVPGLVDGVEVGTTTVTGTWRGRFATGDLAVVAETCVSNDPWDVVVVVDDGGVFMSAPVTLGPGPGGGVGDITLARALRRFNSTAAAAYPVSIIPLLLAMDLRDTGALGLHVGSGWETETGLGGTVVGTARTGADRIWVPGSGWTNEIPAVRPYIDAGSNVGGGLIDAWGALMGPDGRADARKLVVLFSTGGETSCSPSARSAADVLVAAGVDVAVITPLQSSDTHIRSFCDAGMAAYDSLSLIPSPTCLFFPGAEYMADFGDVLRSACESCGGYGYGY